MKEIFKPLKSTYFFIWTIFFLTVSISTHGQESKTVVSGVVKDEAGRALPGVNILEKGTQNGVVSDQDGRFRLKVNSETSKVILSYQGYKRKEVVINGDQTIDVQLKTDIKALNQVEVTATRSPQDIENVPQKVKVIDRQAMDQTIAEDVTDLVKKTAGVDVIQYPGLLSGVGIRGFRPQFSGINQRTLVLIDGRPAGATNLATLNLNNAERIEVLKGPASALYGAQAMGGVINIITKKSDGNISGNAHVGVGSFGTTKGGFAIGGAINEALDFDVSFKNFNRTKDYQLGDGNMFRNILKGDEAQRILWTEEGKEEVPVDDARGDGDIRPHTTYSNYTGAVRLGYEINNDWRIDINGDRFLANNVNTPGDIKNGDQRPGLKDLDRYGGDITISGNMFTGNNLTAKLYASKQNKVRYDVEVNDTTTLRTEYKRSDDNLNWVGWQIKDRQQLGNHFVTVGVDFNRVEQENLSYNESGEANSISAQSPNFNQQSTGIYAQSEWSFIGDKLNVNAGLRYENIQYNIKGTDLFEARSETSNVVNPSLGLNYNVVPGLYLHTTFGTGFTTVDVFEIAGYTEQSADVNTTDGVDTVDVWKGNPGLENQKSRTFDVGIRYVNNPGGISADVTFFHTKFENNVISKVIQYPDETAESGATIRNKNTYTNAQGTTLSGIELDADYKFNNAGINVFANGVYILQAEEIQEIYRQPDPLTLDMHNVADFTLNYGIAYNKLEWLSTRLSGRYVGKRVDTDWSFYLSPDNGFGAGNYADIQYPAFMTLDWTTTFKVHNHQLSVMINNLTDENYYEKRGFNLMGRNFLVQYTHRF